MNRRNYIPSKDRDFLVWITNLLLYLMSRTTKFNFPKDDYDQLEQEKNIYAQKLDVATSPATRTPMNVKGKNIAKKVLETHIRKSVKTSLINNPLLTAEDLMLLGLPVHKTTRTPIPPPTDTVELLLRQLTGHRVEVVFFPSTQDPTARERREAKPYGVRGVEIRWAVLSEPPASEDDLVHSEFDTRSPYTFQFKLPHAGKTLYVCARWENTTAKKGPWSSITSAIIP
jgi:hypothetical protein